MERTARFQSRASVHQQGASTYHGNTDGNIVLAKLLSGAIALLEANEAQGRRKNSHDDRNEEQAEATMK